MEIPEGSFPPDRVRKKLILRENTAAKRPERPHAAPDPPALDNAVDPIRMGVIPLLMPNICTHTRTELIARRDGVDYVRCLDCDQVFEADDLESVPAREDEDDNPQ